MEINTDALPTSAFQNALLVVIIIALIIGFEPRLWPARRVRDDTSTISVAFCREKYQELVFLVAMHKVLGDKWVHVLQSSPELQALYWKADTQLGDIAKDAEAIEEKIREHEALPEDSVSPDRLVAILEDLCRSSERVTAVLNEFTAGAVNMAGDEVEFGDSGEVD